MFDDFEHGIVVTERRWCEEKTLTLALTLTLTLALTLTLTLTLTLALTLTLTRCGRCARPACSR